jgi:hypothetical protein
MYLPADYFKSGQVLMRKQGVYASTTEEIRRDFETHPDQESSDKEAKSRLTVYGRKELKFYNPPKLAIIKS